MRSNKNLKKYSRKQFKKYSRKQFKKRGGSTPKRWPSIKPSPDNHEWENRREKERMEEMEKMCKDKTSVIYNKPNSPDKGKEATIIKVDSKQAKTTIYDTDVVIKFNDGRKRSTVCKYLEKNIQKSQNSRKSNTRKSNTRKSNTRKSNTRKSNTRKSNTRKSNTRKSKSSILNELKGLF